MIRSLTWLTLVGSRLANRRFIFTLVALAVCGAKAAHLHNHQFSVAPKRMLLFFFSFYTQDILLLLFIRLLLDHWLPSVPGKLRLLVTTLTGCLISYNVVLGIISVSFYIVAGSEIHWRNIGFVADPTSRAILLSGLVTFSVVVCLSLSLSGLFQGACYGLFGLGADIVNWPIAFVGRKLDPFMSFRNNYDQIPQRYAKYRPSYRFTQDDDNLSLGGHLRYNEKPKLSSLASPLPSRGFDTYETPVWPSIKCALRTLPHIVVTILLTALFTLTFLRPKDSSLIFLSWTSGLLPFIDFASTSPFLDDLPFYFGTGIQRGWDERSALTRPTTFSWMPKDTPLAGFEDWYANQTHYDATADPMKISNLDEPLLKSLRGKLRDISVRHVVIFFLESTRNDVFPIKKNGLVWNRFAETFPNHQLPQEVQDRLADLTPTANFITGDYDDGFEHDEKKKRGGIRFTDAHTAGTYTLKSMVGTVCGVAPLVGDFNLEHSHHIYQPCLPHVLEALNKVEGTQEETTDGESNWKSYFFQAATLDYDNQNNLMAAMGFPKENTIGREYLRSPTAKHGPVTLPNINEFAFEEDPLENYISDIFADANDTNDRVFLTHLTSTTHHRFHMPAKEPYVPMARGLDMMSRYINTEGYGDKWIRKVLNILDEQGVANETLVIFLGDHGVSLPENNFASPYYNPNIGVDHVPLVISHPQLPAFDAHDAVHSSQILPTILDILLETGSLNNASRQVAADLIHNYEGQSLLRPLNVANNQTGQGQWQFTVTNPGRAMLTVRDARYPERHLVVPVIENVDWRFSNLTSDPHEHHSTQSLDFISFLQSIEEKYGREVAEWAEEGAFITRWFVKENSKRWRFDHGGKAR
ncbi:alkaline-phosphatase-like protein [Dactylonectria macrodidyma]|uniref:Alkaline-phosphatase-like protein n=1 Tax=Dactylonectria macrodidyma TaxID=307937 RepID=A0A9P9JAN6_9HYPO|nr:alkaline-phosphatase-like protein [Dactylonectria macrodidyma]